MRAALGVLGLLIAGWVAPGVAGASEDALTASVDGYVVVDAAGVVHAVGAAESFAPDTPVRRAGEGAMSLAVRPDGEGYTVAFADGSVGASGAAHLPDLASRPDGERLAALRLTPDLVGSWTVTPSGRVLAEGTATHHGDLVGVPLQAPITDLVATASGNGYWLVAGDGGVFAFGDAGFHGSMGGRVLNAPVVDLVADPDGVGYWLVAADGGVFAFAAPFVGSLPGVLGGRPLNAPVVAGVSAPGGYVMVGADGGIFVFADGAPFLGSLAEGALPSPIVDIEATYAVERWRARGEVIDDGDGPRLCFGVLDSLPPQCGGGPRLVDLDWTLVDSVETVGGTKWGSADLVVGAVDAATPLHEAVRAVGRAGSTPFEPRRRDGLEPMCDPPPGGWTHPDPDRVSKDRFLAALSAARGVPGFANSAVGRIVPLGPFPPDPAGQEAWLARADDPFNDIVTVRAVGDPAPFVAAIREAWGGPLCVLPARFTSDQLHERLAGVPLREPNLISGGGGWFDGIRLDQVEARGGGIEALDRQLGPNLFTTSAWLHPLP